MATTMREVLEAIKNGFPLPQGGHSLLKGVKNMDMVKNYFKEYPQAKLYECCKHLGMSKVTVIKHLKKIRGEE